ncbi:RagB/SusD family nutrient uptake outer membrane protein [Flavobacterium sp. MAHUQ-51]|uniref:RagB/SusD family nutrient uptake outer membrane protein n=1 Tax=Flavobacterium sp. GCM10022190 TaxID=3252639 RepID=UPI00361A4700
MKKYFNNKIMLAFLSVGMLSASCESYLEEENKSFVSIETSQKYPQTFDQLVAAVYLKARETTTKYTSNMYYVLEDMGTDIITRGGIVAGVDENNDYVNFSVRNWPVQVYWSNQYSLIASANIVIDNAETIQGVSVDTKKVGLGEAKFFRAMAYFNLVENFGGVPLVLNQVKTAERNFTRETEENVYKQIVADLTDALDGVPATTTVYGRLTKDAVRHFMSKVLLTRGYKSFGTPADFTQSASLADAVIANHALVSSFASLTSIENQRNSEVIFSYLFGSNSSSMGWGNSRHQLYKFEFFNYPGLKRSVKGVSGMPTPYFYSLFDDNDQRAAGTFKRVLYADQNFSATINGMTVNGVVGDTIMYFPKVAWSDSKIATKKYFVINPDKYFTSDGTTAVHHPIFRKFDDPSAPFAYGDQRSQGQRDMVIMRSGEAYLIAAEAYLKASNATTAAQRLTTLRSRAGITTPVTSGQVTIDFILDERARELAGEVNRWMDLKRTNKLVERAKLYNPHVAFNNALKPYHMLRPIPQSEIDLTGGMLTQNPEYTN